MLISKSIILPEFESIESLEQAGDILHKITEAMKDHQIQNYDDAVASYRRITTGRIQSQDGETYFDLDSGVIRGEIVFKPGSSGLDNVEEASPNDWDNAFRLANAVKGDDDFTLISGSKILTGSIAVGAFNSDVIARMFSSGASQEAIEGWMKSGAITYIDGAKIYANSITLSGAGGAANDFDYESLGGTKPPTDADHTADIVSAMAYESTVELAKLGTTIIDGGYIKTSLLTATNIRTGTLRAVRIQVGGGTNEDIYFEDSGIRFYDGSGSGLIFYKSGLQSYFINMGASAISTGGVGISRTEYYSDDKIILNCVSNAFYFYPTGTFTLPRLTNAPTAHDGDCALKDAAVQSSLHIYVASASNWYHSTDTVAGW